MNINDAVTMLNAAKRVELRDHAFSDREITWHIGDEEIASGYFGGSCCEVVVHALDGELLGKFEGHEARRLALCGRVENVFRNDKTGPDYYGGL